MAVLKRLAGFYLLCINLLFWCCVSGAGASTLIFPTRLVIEPEEKAVALWMENQGNTPKLMQVRVFLWTQVSGKEVLSEQQIVVASPPMVTIEPGRRQLIRFINTLPVPEGREVAYRALIDELPSPESVEKPAATGVRFQMRYSIPVFVYGPGLPSVINPLNAREESSLANPDPSTPALRWRLVKTQGENWLEITNGSLRHVHLGQIRFSGDSRPLAHDNQLSGYILPGVSMRWQLPSGTPVSGALRAVVNRRLNAEIIPPAD